MSIAIGCVSILVVFALAICVLYKGWQTAIDPRAVCAGNFSPLQAMNGVVVFYVEKEQITEPTFGGSFYIALPDASIKEPVTLHVVTSGGSFYAPSNTFVRMSQDSSFNSRRMDKPEGMTFVRIKGSHRMFPFDSADLQFTFQTTPVVNVPVIEVENHVPGFYMPCSSFSAKRANDGTLSVAFSLKRDLLTRFTAVLLLTGGIFFALAITFRAEAKTLPTAIGSYFFSLWSVRGIFALTPESFPTIMDIGILGLCLFLIVLLATRLLLQYRGTIGPKRPD